jgi:hypothetical protein
MKLEILRLRQRWPDLLILGYFFFNLVFISYFFDLEQIVIPDASHFSYPVWPPKFLVDLAHWWGQTFDPLLFARPVWWRATIWIDFLFFGPYYLFAIYAFIRGRRWIRIPTIIYSSVMLTNVAIIFSEELWGVHATPQIAAVLGANATWVIAPIYLLWRMCRSDQPFVKKPGRHAN